MSVRSVNVEAFHHFSTMWIFRSIFASTEEFMDLLDNALSLGIRKEGGKGYVRDW